MIMNSGKKKKTTAASRPVSAGQGSQRALALAALFISPYY